MKKLMMVLGLVMAATTYASQSSEDIQASEVVFNSSSVSCLP